MDTLKKFHSIVQISEHVWESLAGDDVVCSYGWFKTMEETYARDRVVTYYLFEENGVPIGATISYLATSPRRDVNLDSIFFGRSQTWAHRVGLTFLPALVCYFRAYGKHFLMADHLDRAARQRVTVHLLDAIEAEAARYQASLCFLRVMESELELWQLLRQRNYRLTLDFPLTYLDILWSNCKGYQDHIRRRSRKTAGSIRNEINRNRREGVVIESWTGEADLAPRMWTLLNQNYQKYNPGVFPFQQNFFERLWANLGDEAVVYIARKKEHITGVSVTLRRGAVAYTPMVGVDHALAGPDATYFVLGIYRPIQYAIDKHLMRIYFGNAQYSLKQRRGCKISNSYIFYKSPRPAVNNLVGLWFLVHRIWFEKKHCEYNLQPYRPVLRDRSA
jgi:predicted N-acyltransferase